jgi:hypothetical protein
MKELPKPASSSHTNPDPIGEFPDLSSAMEFKALFERTKRNIPNNKRNLFWEEPMSQDMDDEKFNPSLEKILLYLTN